MGVMFEFQKYLYRQCHPIRSSHILGKNAGTAVLSMKARHCVHLTKDTFTWNEQTSCETQLMTYLNPCLVALSEPLLI